MERCQINPGDQELFVMRRFACQKSNLRSLHAQRLGQDFDQGLIGLPFFRGLGDDHLKSSGMHARDGVLAGSGLRLDGEDDSAGDGLNFNRHASTSSITWPSFTVGRSGRPWWMYRSWV